MRAEDQLRSMGDESEWQKFYEADENPFEGRSISHPLFQDPGVMVEQVEEKPRLKTLSSTERSTTERTSGATKEEDENNAGYQPEAPRGRSDQPIVIKPLYRIGVSEAHPRLEYQSKEQHWTEPSYFTPQYKAAMKVHEVPGEV